MKLKKVFAAFTVIAVSAALCGCNIADFGTDNLLRPPKTMGNEAAIEQLIADSTGNKYTLKYPKSGGNRSAITMTDLDNDGTNEAVAFCREGDDTTRTHMLVMYSSNNEWKLSSDSITEASDVDCVDFADINGDGNLEIISGYSTYTTNINILSCHTYNAGVTDKIRVEQKYSSFACGDFNSDGNDEIITLLLYTTENEASAVMLDYSEEKDSLFPKANVSMDPNVVKFQSIIKSEYDGIPAILIDGLFSDDEINTQLIYYNKELSLLRNPLYHDKTRSFTQRSLNIPPSDINGDGNPELPSVSKMPYPSTLTADKAADKIDWYSFSIKDETTAHAATMISDYSQDFTFTVPEGWQLDKVTAFYSADGNALEFYEWNKTQTGNKLFEIRAFEAAQWDVGKYADEYTLITKSAAKAYALKNEKTDSPLSLEDSEIKTAFSVMNDTAV